MDEWSKALCHTLDYIPSLNVSDTIKKVIFHDEKLLSLLAKEISSDTIIVTYEITERSDTCYTNIYIDTYATNITITNSSINICSSFYENKVSLDAISKSKRITLHKSIPPNIADFYSPINIIQYFRLNDIMPIPNFILNKLRRENTTSTYISIRIIEKSLADFYFEPYTITI